MIQFFILTASAEVSPRRKILYILDNQTPKDKENALALVSLVKGSRAGLTGRLWDVRTWGEGMLISYNLHYSTSSKRELPQATTGLLDIRSSRRLLCLMERTPMGWLSLTAAGAESDLSKLVKLVDSSDHPLEVWSLPIGSIVTDQSKKLLYRRGMGDDSPC